MTELAIIGLAARLGVYADLDAYIADVITGTANATAPYHTCSTADIQAITSTALGQARTDSRTVEVLLGINTTGQDTDALILGLPKPPADIIYGESGALFETLRHAANVVKQRDGLVLLLVIIAPEGAIACAITRRNRADERDVLAVIDSDMITEQIDLSAIGGARAVSTLEWVGGTITQDALRAFSVAGGDLTCVLSSAESILGMPSELASFAKVVTLLHRRTHAPWTPAQTPPDLSEWHDWPFYTAPEPRPWFAEPDIGRRITAMVTPKTSLILFGETQIARPVERYASKPYANRAYLIPLAGASEAELRRKLSILREDLLGSATLAEITTRAGARYQREANAPYAIALVVRSTDQLRKEIDLALDGIQKAFATGKPWKTPRGSTFTAQPQGEHGVAFVYPGAFNAYVGLGRELFLAFPMLNEWLTEFISNVGRSVAERSLFPRSRKHLDEDVLNACSEQLVANPVAMIESGTTFSVAYTLLMQNLFRVRPSAAFGYSLGEISMLWASGVWASADAASDAWLSSPLYRTRLCGPKEVVRDAWQIPQGEEAGWQTWLLKARRDQVEALVADEPRVYLTITNLENEVVIAGEPGGCQRVIEKLACHALRAPFDSVIHNPLARSEYETFLKLYTHPVVAQPDCRFYSAATYQPLVLEDHALAHAIADMCCQPVDFPRLVNTVAEAGPRIFIELGAQGTCSRWIDRIMRGTPYAAVSINRPRAGDYESVLMVLAQLVAHRVPVELTPIFAPHWEEEKLKPTLVQPALRRRSNGVRDDQLSSLRPEPVVASMVMPAVDQDRRLQAFTDGILPVRRQVSHGQLNWLEQRASQQQSNTDLIRLQLSIAERWLTGHTPAPAVMLDRAALTEFAAGDITACLGDAYRVFDGRRLPRIPNGDLLLIDRVLATDALPGQFDTKPVLTAEVDVPEHTWYSRDSDVIPLPVLMEMALQPCGVLSAYMQTPMLDVESDLYFRNLDGEAKLLSTPDVRGKTVQSTVRLLSTTRVKGIILQRFGFEMRCDGVPFYIGESSFGYFAKAALLRQAGFTGADNISQQFVGNTLSPVDTSISHNAQLDLVTSLYSQPGGGRFGKGGARGEVVINPDDWYFSCHFHQDPVMPGSLGVAAAQQILRHLCGIKRAGWDVPGVDTKWRYRGQIGQHDDRMAVEVHVKEMETVQGVKHVIADAGVYKDGVLIYDIRGLSVSGQG